MAPMDVIWLFFSLDVAFAHHFVATHLPPSLPPYKSSGALMVLATPVNELSKTAGNSASYPLNGRLIGR